MESFNEICPGCALLHQFIMICHYLSFPENIVLITDLFTAIKTVKSTWLNQRIKDEPLETTE